MTINTSRDAAVHWYGQEGHPLVVVLHDWNGRLPWADAFARQLEAEGYRVAVPDFYAGRTTLDDDDSAALLTERLDDMEGAEHILSETIGEARALGSASVALVGFSMGSTIALEYAVRGSVDAVVAYYGSIRTQDAHLRVPVLFQLAESDDWSDKEAPEAMRERLAAEGGDVSINAYDGAVHGFVNAQQPHRHSADAAAKAWVSTKEFLAEHLGSGD